MKYAAIRSTGRHVPRHTIHNEALDQFPSGAKLMISSKTGVFCRHHASPDQCTSDLAILAAENCLGESGIGPEQVEAIVLSTSSPDRIQPATATRVQHRLGAQNAFAFDINSVCSGSTFGIALCQALIGSGMCANVLFIAAEIYSRFLDPNDFSTYPYFGDGAGAILFTSNEEAVGVIDSVLATDGSGNDTICVPAGGTMMPLADLKDSKSAYFHMKGRDVFQFAVEKGSQVIETLLDKANIAIGQVKCIICHQANVNIVLKIAERLRIDEEKFFMNLFRHGNTASASVLMALDEARRSHAILPGDLVVTAAFGGGLSWGANLIRL